MKKIVVCFWLLCSFCVVRAQNMNVILKDGTLVQYNVGNVDKVVFGDIEGPVADAFSDVSMRIPEYWYAAHSSSKNRGYDEMRLCSGDGPIYYESVANDSTVEKGSFSFGTCFSYIFYGNEIKLSSYQANGGSESYSTSLVFASENVGRKWCGYDRNGKLVEYTITVSDDGLVLYASASGVTETVATISFPESGINSQCITVNNKSDFAKSLINYDLPDTRSNDYFKATIAMKVVSDGRIVPCTNSTFDVRCIRPMSAEGKTSTLHMDNTVKQRVELRDLVKLADWRGYNNEGYPCMMNYLGIESIRVAGCDADGMDIGNVVTTNYKGDNYTRPLKEVLDGFDLSVTYSKPKNRLTDSYGYIEFYDHSGCVKDFCIRVPLVIDYAWGSMFVNAELYVVATWDN